LLAQSKQLKYTSNFVILHISFFLSPAHASGRYPPKKYKGKRKGPTTLIKLGNALLIKRRKEEEKALLAVCEIAVDSSPSYAQQFAAVMLFLHVADCPDWCSSESCSGCSPRKRVNPRGANNKYLNRIEEG
jgi:hypothetical protein